MTIPWHCECGELLPMPIAPLEPVKCLGCGKSSVLPTNHRTVAWDHDPDPAALALASAAGATVRPQPFHHKTDWSANNPTQHIIDKLAKTAPTPKPKRPPKNRRAWRGILGFLAWAVAAGLFLSQLDMSLFHIPALLFGVIGLILIISVLLNSDDPI